MKKCFVIAYNCRGEESHTCLFREKADAQKFVLEKAQTEAKLLEKLGYHPVVERLDDSGSMVVHVPGTVFFCARRIFEPELR